MNFARTVNKEVANLLKTPGFRTCDGYEMEFERQDDYLICTTWGFDREGFAIPADRPSLVAEKVKRQLNHPDPITKIALAFYLRLMRALDDGAR